ncbi:hypothetical protein QAD02_012807 [Eretmocerus hayati]|uniref:Uncharacterized protein n=1 Tax=Eretmocerus hayati TaxID=131215 RepID=A0ACC2P0F0_9HYME|nr:hypothetical protein QAD02_012807 [Eretmocerus hayati]
MMNFGNLDGSDPLISKYKNKTYKWCFVPPCTSTSNKNPDKVFFKVPQDKDIRKEWFTGVRRADQPKTCNYFCCQDHFDLRSDMENFVRFQLYGGNLKLKCNNNMVLDQNSPFNPCNRDAFTYDTENLENHQKGIEDFLTEKSEGCHQAISGVSGQCSHNMTTNQEYIGSEHSSTGSAYDMRVRGFGEDAQVQVEVLGLQAQGVTVDKACSPIGFLSSDSKSLDNSSKNSSLIQRSDGSKSYVPSTTGTSSPEKCPSQSEKELKFAAINVTRYLISKNPRKYLEIPEQCMPWMMNLLKKHTGFSEENINLTLMKIRMDDNYGILGDEFDIFHSSTIQEEVQRNLPIPFRAYYGNVYALIDAFEIQINKPSNLVHQSLTWSDYKACDTWKWVILCTADGETVFVSKAYGGRVSDTLLFETCGVMDILPTGCSVMADRGFKGIEGLLQKKNIELVRPPSVFEATQPTKGEVLETRRISALRIHVERLIRRVREFKILQPHSCLDLNIASQIDDIVQLVCGLINLQAPLIRT